MPSASCVTPKLLFTIYNRYTLTVPSLVGHQTARPTLDKVSVQTFVQTKLKLRRASRLVVALTPWASCGLPTDASVITVICMGEL